MARSGSGLLALALLVAITGCSGPGSEQASTPAPATKSAAGSVATYEPAHARTDWSGLFNNVYQYDRYYFAGTPTEDGVRRAAGEGVKVIVSLLPESQQAERVPFDEPALAKSLGVRYVNIPMVPSTFSKEDVDQFAAVLGETDGGVLVHCASSNRCGGLWAAYLNLDEDVPLDRAIELGRSAGLNRDSMVDAVRRVTGSSTPDK